MRTLSMRGDGKVSAYSAPNRSSIGETKNRAGKMYHFCANIKISKHEKSDNHLLHHRFRIPPYLKYGTG